MKWRLSDQAANDLFSIAAYIKTRSPAGAESVSNTIRASIENVAAIPTIGRKQKVSGVRKLPVRRYPYLVFYTLDEVNEEVVVISIRDPARQRLHQDR
jgi:toxin ParE1/3/4